MEGMQTKFMQDTCIQDLEIQFNYPYLYCHQLNCEHWIYFRQMRLIHESDSQDNSIYPCQFILGKMNLPTCGICRQAFSWITMNDPNAKHVPFYWCGTCFDQFHLDSDGNALYEFEAIQFDKIR